MLFLSFGNFYDFRHKEDNLKLAFLQTEQIICEYKHRALHLHPDKNSDPEAQEQFRQIQRAKDVLANPEQRKKYDKWRNSGVAMNFEDWSNLSANVHSSMHWMNSKRSDPMIKNTTNGNTSSEEKLSKWESDSPNEMLRKFRNYDI